MPRAPAANFDWSKLRNKAEYARLSPPRIQVSAQLERERRAPFPSVVAFPLRWKPNGKKYRLYCWLHRHEKPTGGKYYDQVYSLTVWDREVGSLSFTHL